jgi:hypothetical protein
MWTSSARSPISSNDGCVGWAPKRSTAPVSTSFGTTTVAAASWRRTWRSVSVSARARREPSAPGSSAIPAAIRSFDEMPPAAGGGELAMARLQPGAANGIPWRTGTKRRVIPAKAGIHAKHRGLPGSRLSPG